MNDLLVVTNWNYGTQIALLLNKSNAIKILRKMGVNLKHRRLNTWIQYKKHSNLYLRTQNKFLYGFTSDNTGEYNARVVTEILKVYNDNTNKRFMAKNMTLEEINYQDGASHRYYFLYITKALYSYLKMKTTMHPNNHYWDYIDYLFSDTEEMKQRRIKEVDDLYKLCMGRSD